MPRKPDYTGISVKEEFAKSIESFIYEHPELGYRSIAQFLEDASRRRLEELKSQIKPLPRFEQINCDENGFKILDRQLHEVIQIFVKPQGIKCGFHQLDVCEHIDFALGIKENQELIKERKKEGWHI